MSPAVVLTHPAAWATARLGLLTEAAARAGLGTVDLVAEPVAAAAHFASGQQLPEDRCVAVYDLGAGTFDVSVVRRTAGGFEVVAADGLTDVGGLDLDAAVVDRARGLTAGAALATGAADAALAAGAADAADAWGRLDWPQTARDQQARRALWLGARAAKEQLTRHTTADLHLPLIDAGLHLTRDEFERAARPHLERTTALTVAVLRRAGVAPERVAGVFLVGGSSRIQLAATLLHCALRISPTVVDQPELVVAEGSILVAGLTSGSAVAPGAFVVPPAAPPPRAAAPGPSVVPSAAPVSPFAAPGPLVASGPLVVPGSLAVPSAAPVSPGSFEAPPAAPVSPASFLVPAAPVSPPVAPAAPVSPPPGQVSAAARLVTAAPQVTPAAAAAAPAGSPVAPPSAPPVAPPSAPPIAEPSAPSSGPAAGPPSAPPSAPPVAPPAAPVSPPVPPVSPPGPAAALPGVVRGSRGPLVRVLAAAVAVVLVAFAVVYTVIPLRDEHWAKVAVTLRGHAGPVNAVVSSRFGGAPPLAGDIEPVTIRQRPAARR